MPRSPMRARTRAQERSICPTCRLSSHLYVREKSAETGRVHDTLAVMDTSANACRVLDCKGLNCPMPIVRLSQAIHGIESGARIVIEANDPAFRADLEAWVRRFGHTILAFEEGLISRATVLKK